MNTIKQSFEDYYNEIPEHSLRAIGLSGIYSFTATVALLSLRHQNQHVHYSRAIYSAGIAVVASTIQALTMPFFNYAFNNKGEGHSYNPYQDYVHVLCSLAVSEILINQTMGTTVNLTTGTFSHLLNKNLYIVFSTSVIKASIVFWLVLTSKIGNLVSPGFNALVVKIFHQAGYDDSKQTTSLYVAV